MSHAEERSTPPQKAVYRAPGTMVAGSVEKLTAGGNDGGYSDGYGGWYGLAFTGEETPDGGDALEREADGDDEAGSPDVQEEE